MLIAGRVSRNRRLLQPCSESSRSHEFHKTLLRHRQQHIERLNTRLPSPLIEFLKNPFRILPVARRSGVVRISGEKLVRVSDNLRARDRAELRLPLLLRLGVGRRKTLQGRVGLRRRSQRPALEAEEDKACEDDHPTERGYLL